MVSDDLAALAAAAYIYGFPLVFDLQMVSGKADMGRKWKASMPTNMIATIRREVATGRRMKGRDGFIAGPAGRLAAP